MGGRGEQGGGEEKIFLGSPHPLPLFLICRTRSQFLFFRVFVWKRLLRRLQKFSTLTHAIIFLNNVLVLSCFSLGEDEDSDAAQEDGSARDSEDEAEWDRLQADVKGRDPILDPKSKESHIVHAPYFPEVRTDLNIVALSN